MGILTATDKKGYTSGVLDKKDTKWVQLQYVKNVVMKLFPSVKTANIRITSVRKDLYSRIN